MRRKSLMALMLAAALAIAPMSGQLAMAAEADEIESYAYEDGDGVIIGSDFETEIAAPTGLTWSDDGRSIYCDLMEEVTDEDYYYFEVYRDGQWVGAFSSFTSSEGHIFDGKLELDNTMSTFFNESGRYKFHVRINNWGGEGGHYSQWSEWSEERVYERPENELGTTVGYWSDTEPYIFYYMGVEGAGGYRINIECLPADGSQPRRGWSYWLDSEAEPAGILHTYNIRDYVEGWYGEGKYRISVTAYSLDINVVANGREGEYSDTYETTVVSSQVAGLIEKALENLASGSVQDVLEEVKEISTSTLRTSMQSNSDVLDMIEELEKKYVEEGLVESQPPKVSEAASDYVDEEKITVVGAGLNGKEGDTVQLKVDVPTEEQEVVLPSQYSKSVQLTISLECNEEPIERELDIPVTVTMPIPAGVSLRKLVILHYHADGGYEVIYPRDNGDGTITFTVDKFSTFVFAEEEEEEEEKEESSGSTQKPAVSAPVHSGSTGFQEKILDVDWSVVNSSIDEGLKAGVQNVYALTGTKYVVPASTTGKLAGSNTALIMQTGSSMAVSISGQDVKKADKDLSVTLSFSEVIPKEAKNRVTAGAILSREFAMAEKVFYPFKVDFHMNLGRENAGKVALLYHYDEITASMKFSGSWVITDAGSAMFAVTHGDEYLVVVTDREPQGLAAGSYIVLPGDTLTGIARKLGVSLEALIQANPQIKDRNKIYPGQAINLR